MSLSEIPHNDDRPLSLSDIVPGKEFTMAQPYLIDGQTYQPPFDIRAGATIKIIKANEYSFSITVNDHRKSNPYIITIDQVPNLIVVTEE